MTMREITFLQALDEAVAEEMRRDERVITLGTDFTGDPIKEFGPQRVRFTPDLGIGDDRHGPRRRRRAASGRSSTGAW